jgi:hypothetical protein
MRGRAEAGRPRSRFGIAVDTASRTAKRHPLGVAMIAAAAAWLFHRMSKGKAQNSSWHRRMGEAEGVRVLNTGHARIYDPDASPLHPTQDSLESRREMSARV